jgi:CheY-like chemotaxis protein
LEWTRSQPHLKSIVIAVLTGSNRRADADRARELGADFYLTKPGKFPELIQMMCRLHEWLRLNHFSTKDAGSKLVPASN